jgi:hypothetical protein
MICAQYPSEHKKQDIMQRFDITEEEFTKLQVIVKKSMFRDKGQQHRRPNDPSAKTSSWCHNDNTNGLKCKQCGVTSDCVELVEVFKIQRNPNVEWASPGSAVDPRTIPHNGDAQWYTKKTHGITSMS